MLSFHHLSHRWLSIVALTLAGSVTSWSVVISPTRAQSPTDFSPQCQTAIQASIAALKGGRSVTVHTNARSLGAGHPANRGQGLLFALDGPATGAILADGPLQMAVARRLIQSCGTVGAVTIGRWQSGESNTIGLVNGTVRFFECYEGETPNPGWGYVRCDL